jgi:hypothetical protein
MESASTRWCSSLLSDRLDKVADALDNARSEASKADAAVANAENPVANADVVDLAACRRKVKPQVRRRFRMAPPGEIRTRAPGSGGRNGAKCDDPG